MCFPKQQGVNKCSDKKKTKTSVVHSVAMSRGSESLHLLPVTTKHKKNKKKKVTTTMSNEMEEPPQIRAFCVTTKKKRERLPEGQQAEKKVTNSGARQE